MAESGTPDNPSDVAGAGSPGAGAASPESAGRVDQRPHAELLAEFRRAAAGIVAQYRGITPAARVKLAEVARQVNLPEESLEEAIGALSETSGAGKADPLAEKFRRRLLKDLQASRGAILGPTHEARILAAGKEKFSLERPAALAVLGDVVSELGLQWIRGDEATRNLAAAAQDALGDRTWLDDATRGRLQLAGKNWGLSQRTVDQLIEEQLAANREAASQTQRRSRWLYGGVALAAASVLAMGLVIALRPAPSTSTGLESVPSKPSNASSDQRKRPPKWWTVELALAIEKARRIERFEQVEPLLSSDDERQRATGYAGVVELVERVPPDPRQLSVVGELLPAAYAAEPGDQAAAAIRDKLMSHLPTEDSPLPKHSAAYELSFWAAATALDAAAAAKQPRQSQMLEALAERTATTLDASSPVRKQSGTLKAALADLHLRHLTSQARRNPAAAIELLPSVADRAKVHLEPESLRRRYAEFLRLVAAQIEDSSAAKLRPLVVEAATATDIQTTLTLIDAFESIRVSSLRDELRNLLLLRLNLSLASASDRAAARAMRQALGVSPSGNQALEQRWEQLLERAEAALQRRERRATNLAQQLTDAAEYSWLATQALALSQGETGLPVYDEIVSQHAEGAFALKVNDEESEALPAPVASEARLSVADEQALNRFIETINRQGTSQIERESALRGIAQLGPKIRELSASQTRRLANYLLRQKADAEHEVATTMATALRRSRQLRLAVADGLESGSAAQEQKQSLVGALVGRRIDSAEPLTLYRDLLESVRRDLVPAAANAGTVGNRDEARLLASTAATLVEQYRVRARLLGISPARYQQADLPSQALRVFVEAGVAHDAARGAGTRTRGGVHAERTGWPTEAADRWAKELEIADYLAQNDLQRTALLNDLLFRLAVEAVIAERPQRADDALQIVREYREAQRNAKSATEQLRQGEAFVLQAWLLLRPEGVG